MVMVKGPFLSMHASGSIAKTITCRAQGNNKFCMHQFRHTQKRRSYAQVFYQNMFAKKIRLMKNFYKVAEYRSGILGKAVTGISILGAIEDMALYLNKFPPLIKGGP